MGHDLKARIDRLEQAHGRGDEITNALATGLDVRGLVDADEFRRKYRRQPWAALTEAVCLLHDDGIPVEGVEHAN